jgi:putative membrane protein
MSGTSPPSTDELAMQRTVMASERTFMAWTRTALSLISFGFTIPKILEYTEGPKLRLLGNAGPRILGTTLIALGVFTLAVSSFEHWHHLRRMKITHHMEFRTSRLSYVVAIVLFVLGAFALANIAFQIGPF